MAKDNLHNMMSLDLYLSSLSDEEYNKIKGQIQSLPLTTVPLVSWDISGQAHANVMAGAAKIGDGLKLQEFSKKYSWKSNPAALLNQEYEALVLTDARLNILWVNPGFATMTGYPAKFAIGKKPDFLQGENTLTAQKTHIRAQLQRGLPFTAVITNYRKNKEEYLCQVKVYPLAGKDGQISHFIALEQETA